MLTLKAKVVSTRFHEGEPDEAMHDRVTAVRRNVPALQADGSPKVVKAADGTLQQLTEQVTFRHVFLQIGDSQPFYVEMSEVEAAAFPIGKDVTLTIA